MHPSGPHPVDDDDSVSLPVSATAVVSLDVEVERTVERYDRWAAPEAIVFEPRIHMEMHVEHLLTRRFAVRDEEIDRVAGQP